MANWYKRAMRKIAQQGEYWLTNDGTSMYADGDIGDYNHESYVINHVQSSVVNSSGLDEFDRGEYIDWDGWKQAVVQNYLAEHPEVVQQFQQQGYDPSDIDESEVIEMVYQELGIDQETIAIAEGTGDARLYAMQKWGWKRVQGNNVETWTLTSGDMKAIANGLWDAYQDAAESYAYNINDFSTRKWYNNVPFDLLSSGNVGELRSYRYMGL